MAFFTDATFRFLEDLADHNERAWFEANKKRYEAEVREPALALIRALAPRVESVAPYKTNVGIQLRHVGGADVHAPGIYVHVAPDHSFIGFGMRALVVRRGRRRDVMPGRPRSREQRSRM